MSAVATIAARPSASSAWWRSIATAIRCGRFQRRARTPPTRAWSMPSCSRSSRRRCSGVRETGVEVDLVARVQAGDDEAADVVQQRRHGELVAFDPADDAADLVGGALGGEGVDAEALGLQLPAAVGLEEVEAGRGAGDRQHAGGLQHLDRLGDAADAAGDDAAAVGEAKDGDRQGDVGLDRFDQLADAGGLGGRGGDHPLAGLDQDREALDRLEGLGEAAAGGGGAASPLRAPLVAAASRARTLPLVCAWCVAAIGHHIGR